MPPKSFHSVCPTGLVQGQLISDILDGCQGNLQPIAAMGAFSSISSKQQGRYLAAVPCFQQTGWQMLSSEQHGSAPEQFQGQLFQGGYLLLNDTIVYGRNLGNVSPLLSNTSLYCRGRLQAGQKGHISPYSPEPPLTL